MNTVKFDALTTSKKTKYYHQQTFGGNILVEDHYNDFYEVILVLKDKIYHSLNGEKKWIEENNFIFISPNDFHSFSSQDENTHIFMLSVEKERFETFIVSNQFTPVYGKSYRANSIGLIQKINQIYENPNFTVQLLNALLSELFAYAIRNQISDSHMDIPHSITNALNLMRQPQNLTNGVQRFSELSGYSRSQLSRLIDMYYNKTPHQLLFEIQMSLAKELIEHTNLSFEEISYNVGFASTSRFYAVIKLHFGCTPKTLRNKSKVSTQVKS